jgi:hypothetical protein
MLKVHIQPVTRREKHIAIVVVSLRTQHTSSNYAHEQNWTDLDEFHVCQQPRYYLGDEDIAYAREGSTLKVHLDYHKSIHHHLSLIDL